MRIIVSGGGTGGHIYPAMALIKRLKERNLIEDVLYVGTEKGLESKIVKNAGLNFKTIEIQGFKRRLTLENAKTIKLFLSSIRKSRKIIKEFKPDVVIGTGGYVSSAIVYAAHTMHIPTVIHEQNTIAGVTNKFLAHFVDKIAIAFTEATDQFSEKKKIVFTGNPRAQEVIDIKKNDRLKEFDLAPDKDTVMIFGGSRGAKPINQATIDTMDKFVAANYQILFVTGRVHYDNVVKLIDDKYLKSANVSVLPYIDNMPEILPDIKLIVGRSGATSIAEITALGIPAIFIPSPYVTHDHQTKNAMSVAKVNAAKVIAESELTSEKLFNEINQIMSDETLQKSMSDNSKKIGVPDAADRLIKVLTDLVNK
ncbi:undecaprenyldiphospho-muramoylpentapeptide beta-N- acetylglucosaminyltransferase [Companilactobacillus crustorum]|uniref:UDP-N-acetylglucosamine--N-acetylmuramyl-(pentapeptide) pyrophosphoryl-undecaprenol N-acetylglucosamine transferase n=4 Tax=Companilactobacillus TaxID=2767879 RepID=A0A837RK77_9LACO|nr:undecaprenyldiphospho-muramoylpentapeptide beta-N-acetylglucosaminyltransferase [Companilactobacillus crustorum]KRK42773.1 undecaprenyldiphospho-muramoylpentapeptide beta-N- acetylglucosaminyltransferase [Companilactobacillus crustorum JCM 15951]KRO20429.1 undecaprenyldiphospho-muramoylpentapeptide beta-N- acetylglucosaminyltransferase [Companilactobacillus crustorum]WDT66784.1 undecaprenyldiphospho-muramoylpentapeptide beta-N-acetylglucosaminyltransferase [Companilactobacillus crustorum]HCD